MNGEVKKHREDLRFYRKEKRELKKEFEALKVSVAQMHMTVLYYHMSYVKVLSWSVSNTAVKITCRMITNITCIVCLTCHYKKRYDVQAIHSQNRIRITIFSFMLKIIKHYTCFNNVLFETNLNIQEFAENSPFIIEDFKILSIVPCQTRV